MRWCQRINVIALYAAMLAPNGVCARVFALMRLVYGRQCVGVEVFLFNILMATKKKICCIRNVCHLSTTSSTYISFSHFQISAFVIVTVVGVFVVAFLVVVSVGDGTAQRFLDFEHVCMDQMFVPFPELFGNSSTI